MPEQLLESELFGHAKGAFTGAISDHQGLFQAADGGTLFLDEIGDMPLPLQVKLLRALQERQIRPLGSTASVPVDVRLISATHRDLGQAMHDGDFREDLFYRLNVVNLKLPPLKERAEDVPLLAKYLVSQAAERHKPFVKGFSKEAINLLASSAWPGNVRQLVNVVEQCVALTSSPIIPEALVPRPGGRGKRSADLQRRPGRFERSYLIKVLKITEAMSPRRRGSPAATERISTSCWPGTNSNLRRSSRTSLTPTGLERRVKGRRPGRARQASTG